MAQSHVLLFSAVVMWGWTFVATKILVAELGPVEIFALRLAIGIPVLGGVLLLKRVRWQFTRSDARPLLLGGAIFTLHILIQIAGIVTTTAINTGWIISVTPLVLAVLSFVFLRERIGWSGVAGIAVATMGILLLVSRGSVTDLGWLQSRGDWLVLASVGTWALYTVVTRDLVRRRQPLAVTLGVLLIAATFTAMLVLLGSADLTRVRTLSSRGIAAVLYLGVAGTALGHWFWGEGVARLGAARGSLSISGTACHSSLGGAAAGRAVHCVYGIGRRTGARRRVHGAARAAARVNVNSPAKAGHYVLRTSFCAGLGHALHGSQVEAVALRIPHQQSFRLDLVALEVPVVLHHRQQMKRLCAKRAAGQRRHVGW